MSNLEHKSNIGQKFKVIESGIFFKFGDIVRMLKDDHSNLPLMSLVGGPRFEKIGSIYGCIFKFKLKPLACQKGVF